MVTTRRKQISGIGVWVVGSTVRLGRGEIPQGRGYGKGSWIGGRSKISQWAISCTVEQKWGRERGGEQSETDMNPRLL